MYKKINLKIVVTVSAFIFLTASAFIAGTLIKQQNGITEKFHSTRSARDKCTSMIILKEYTTDDSMILAHNEDLGNYSAHHYSYVPHATHQAEEIVTTFYGAEVPQVSETYAYTGTTIFDISYYPGAVTSGINEYRVAVVNNASYRRDAPDPLPCAGRIIWTEFTKFALERAKTAQEAVDVIGSLASEYMLGADSGTIFGVTDPDEGWWVEVTLDGQWVAQKVDTTTSLVRANIFRIGEVKTDSENFKYSDDLFSYAEGKGWYDPKDTFKFADVYADQEKLESNYNLWREWRVGELLEDRIAAKTVDPKLIMSIWRDHYEGANTEETIYDWTFGHTQGSPHQTDSRTLCRLDTEVSTVIQSRAKINGQDVPADIGAICWRAMATPCTSIYTPWYLGSLEIPKEYQAGVSQFTKKSAYWASRNLSRSVDMRYGTVVVNEVKRVLDEFENKEFASQGEVEQKALELYNKNPDEARAYLTKYSSNMAKKAMRKINSLYKYSERH